MSNDTKQSVSDGDYIVFNEEGDRVDNGPTVFSRAGRQYINVYGGTRPLEEYLGKGHTFVPLVPTDAAQVVVIPEDTGYSQLDMLSSDDDDAECDSGHCFL